MQYTSYTLKLQQSHKVTQWLHTGAHPANENRSHAITYTTLNCSRLRNPSKHYILQIWLHICRRSYHSQQYTHFYHTQYNRIRVTKYAVTCGSSTLSGGAALPFFLPISHPCHHHSPPSTSPLPSLSSPCPFFLLQLFSEINHQRKCCQLPQWVHEKLCHQHCNCHSSLKLPAFTECLVSAPPPIHLSCSCSSPTIPLLLESSYRDCGHSMPIVVLCLRLQKSGLPNFCVKVHYIYFIAHL